MTKRILVHDYSGHPFPTQLSRRLAARGHEVLHVHSSSVLQPRGTLERRPGDPASLGFAALSLGTTIDKQAYARRWLQEREYGRLIASMIGRFAPDTVLSGNTPLDAQCAALRAARRAGARFVYWLQDLQGPAIGTLLAGRLPVVSRAVGAYYTWMERRLLRASDAVVAISDDFSGALAGFGVTGDGVHVIPNWASLEELPPRPRANAWAREHGLVGRFCYLYSGTLGLKHDAGLLVELALAQRARPEVVVVVISEGAKAEWLARRKGELGLDNLRVLPFQPYAVLPDVLGSADVLLALLEADAGTFSVPSKVLSYHCAGRPLLLSVPAQNLAARVVAQAESGVLAPPGDRAAFVAAAERLRASAAERRRLGENALRYARRAFDLERIAERFEAVLVPRLPPQTAAAEEEALADAL